MGFLSFLTGGGSSAIGGIAQGVMSMFTARANRKHQEKENQKDREFNAAEAQKQRDFEEEMYNKNESPIAQAQQRKQAGLSPLEGVSSQSVGGGSSASASSSSLPSAPTPDMSWMTNMGETIANLKKTNAETKLLEEKRIAEYYDNLKRQFDTDPSRMNEVYETNLAKLKAERDAKVLSASEYKHRVEMLEEFRENGGNTYVDEHNESSARAKLTNEEANEAIARASKIRSDEDYVKSQTALNYQQAKYQEDHFKHLLRMDQKEFENALLDFTQKNYNDAVWRATGYDLKDVPADVRNRVLRIYRAYYKSKNMGVNYTIDGKSVSSSDLLSLIDQVMHNYYIYGDAQRFNASINGVSQDISQIISLLK